MTNQQAASVENNFTKGLLTEFTGLNFPENAATDCDNVTFSLVGDVTRRGGFDNELNYQVATRTRSTRAMSSFKWNNVGTDGNTQVLVEQVGENLLFYTSSNATIAQPLSYQLNGILDLTPYTAGGGFNLGNECQYASGNGYLFVFNASIDPVCVTFNGGTLTASRIDLQVRDLSGINETGVGTNVRPSVLTAEHNYNLINQGWVAGNPWQGSDTTSTIVVGLGSKVFTIASGLPITLGDAVTVIYNGNPATPGVPPVGTPLMSGTVTAYSGTSLTVNVNSGSTGYFGTSMVGFLINPRDTAYLTAWTAATGNYPSNADVWWYFKDSTGAFNPATTLAHVSLSSGNAPRGHYILSAFNQQRSVTSGVTGITPVSTTVRPRLGTWFQGRVWYAGVDAQQAATGDAAYYTWTENIYFSQIVQTVNDFGHCYQVNDPTSETLFDLLPTDGGVIRIQGIGTIYKLHPVQNGLLVFGANGIKFITGSQGVGFSANDYTIIDVSEIKSISSTSFVVVNGLPYFWNEEGIYAVTPPPQQGFGFQVQSLTYSTIDTFYNNIPVSCKKYVKGDYDPINYTIQWIYRDTETSAVEERYEYNKILNYNTNNKSFFPYSLQAYNGVNGSSINGINYITHPGGSTAPTPKFKYYTSRVVAGNWQLTFAEEKNFTTYTDWASIGAINYTSYFLTGYKLHGKALKKFQMPYVIVFLRGGANSYKIQGVWDYANSGNSGRYSTLQRVVIDDDFRDMVYRRHRIRGQGLSLQIKVVSVDGAQFDIMGWSAWETQQGSVY